MRVSLPVFLLLALCARGADQPAANLDRDAVLRAAAGVTAAAFPDADAVLVDDLIQTRYEADGTAETIDETWVKILTEQGRQEMESISFGYSLPYGTVSVVRAEIIKPDGRVAVVDLATQSRTMIDREQMQANIFNPNDKTLQLNLSDLEIGDVLRYVYQSREVKARMPDTWCDFQMLESTMPLLHYTYEVSAPAARPLQRVLLRDAIPGTVTATTNVVGGRTVHRWEVRNVPRYFSEPDMPEAYGQVQRLIVSTVPDWPTVSRWYWNLSAPRLAAGSKELEAKASELVAGAATDHEKAARLFRFVSQQVRYMGITTEKEAPGYEPHDVSITFSNRYGVCRDKAALLVAMLRSAGLKGFPVLIHNGPKKDAEVPAPFFNHAIVAVERGDHDYLLMDPTDENSADLLPAYLSDKSYLVARPEGDILRTSPIAPATNNLVRVSSEGTLRRNGQLQLESRVVFEGVNDNIYRGHLATLAPDERRRFIDSRVAQLLPGARLEECVIEPTDLRDTRQPLALRLKIAVPGFSVDGPGHRLLTMPWLGTSFGAVNFVLGQTGLEKRRFPLRTDFACGVDEQVRLQVEGSAAVVSIPAPPPIEEKDVRFSQRIEANGGVLAATSRLLLDAVEYPSNRYLRLKEILRDLEFARRQKVVLATQLPAPAEVDAEVLERDIRIEVIDATHSVQTERYRTRVLTYAGKKRLSELRLDFNPAWESVTVTNAAVVAADGTRRKLAAQEINLMDAAWVGEAPRYPAGRTLVASLPGVEVGAVLEYTIIRDRRDRPFFSTLATFRGFEPVHTSRFAVVMPSSLEPQLRTAAGAVLPRPEEAGGRRTWRWDLEHVPALVREEALPPIWSCVPSVAFSTGTWSNYADAVMTPMREAARGAKATRSLARRLAAEAGPDALAQVRAVRDHIVRAVRLAGPAFDNLPLSVLTPPDRTLEEGYGNSRDRAALFLAMFDELELHPELLLVAGRGAREESLRDLWQACPQAGVLDTVIVKLRAGDRTIYVNDTDQYAEPGVTPFAGRPCLDAAGRPSSVPTDAAFREKVETDFGVVLDTGGTARVTVTTRVYGMGQGAFRRQMERQTPEERRRFIQETVASISQSAKLEGDFRVEPTAYPATTTFAVSVPRFAVRDGRYLYFNLPSQMSVRLPALPNERSNPYYGEEAVEVVTRHDVQYPAGRVLLAPQATEIIAPAGWGRLSLRTEPDPASRRWRSEQRMTFSPALVDPVRYDELQQASARMRHPSLRAVLLELEP